MGLLDDAIREHLELKRRGGTPSEDVARMEHEALGPARREPPGAHGAGSKDEPDTDVRPEEAPAEAARSAPSLDEDERDEAAEPELPQPAGRGVGEATDEWDADEAFAEEEPAGEPVAADEEPEAEDVLEETPDFLQETPEHDRLWFEQKPPRDFDFDDR
jgi:hypothetical protein